MTVTGGAAKPHSKIRPPAESSERVQAQLFAEILRREIVAMQRNIDKAESAWRRRCAAEGYVERPDRLLVVQERIDDATRMLEALRIRFPRLK